MRHAATESGFGLPNSNQHCSCRWQVEATARAEAWDRHGGGEVLPAEVNSNTKDPGRSKRFSRLPDGANCKNDPRSLVVRGT
jgi:hypothetical protein